MKSSSSAQASEKISTLEPTITIGFALQSPQGALDPIKENFLKKKKEKNAKRKLPQNKGTGTKESNETGTKESNEKPAELLEFLEFKNFELPKNLTVYWEKQIQSFCGWHTIQGIFEKLQIPLLAPSEWESIADHLYYQFAELTYKTKASEEKDSQRSLLLNGKSDANLLNQALLSKGLEMRALRWPTDATKSQKNFIENILDTSSFLILFNQAAAHWSYFMKTKIEHRARGTCLLAWINCDSRLKRPLLMSKMETGKNITFEKKRDNLWFVLQATTSTGVTIPPCYFLPPSWELLERKEKRKKETEFAFQFKEKKKSRFRYAWKLGQQTLIAKSQWDPISNRKLLLQKKKKAKL